MKDSRLETAFWLIAVVCLIVWCVTPACYYFLKILEFPYDWDPYEGFSLVAAWAIRAGESPYRDPFISPYTSYPYTPLYPLLISLLGNGKVGDLFVARALSLSSFGVSLLCLPLLLRNIGLSAKSGVAAIGWLLASSSFVIWAPLAKTDMLAFVFSILGLVCLSKGARWFWTLIFFALAVAAKQVMLPYFLLLIGWGLIETPKRRATFGILALLVATISSWVILFGTQSFFSSPGTIFGELSLTRSLDFTTTFFKENPLLILGLAGWVQWVRKNGIFDPVFWFALFSLGFLLLAGHLGSSINYYLWPTLALLVGLLYLISEWKPFLMPLLLLIHVGISKSHFNFQIPPGDLRPMKEIVEFLKMSLEPPLTDEYAMFALNAGFSPHIELESTRVAIWKRYGEKNWQANLLALLKSDHLPPLILAGNRLGALYPALMEGYIPVGKTRYPTWFGEETFAGFIRPELKAKIELACRLKGASPFYCAFTK